MAIDKKKNLTEIVNEVTTPADGDKFYMAEKVAGGFIDAFILKENMPGGGGGGGGFGGTQLGATQTMALDGDIPDFSSIPTGYDYIELHYQLQKDTAGSGSLYIVVNTDTTATNYFRQIFYVNDGSIGSSEANDNVIGVISGNVSGNSSNGIIRIFGYDLGRDKVIHNQNAGKHSDTTVQTGTFTVAWKNTAAINRLRLDDNSSMTGNGFLAGDIFKLIGFKNS